MPSWVVSLTFDDVEAMHASFASPAGQKTTADMSNFITGPMKSVVSESTSLRLIRGADRGEPVREIVERGDRDER